MTSDIKFACSHCEQNMLVEAAAAGLATDCPTCGKTVQIPEFGGFDAQRALQLPAARASEGGEFSAGAPLTESDLALSRRETARIREQLATVYSECERLHATATHTQAEIKSFQTERLAAKSDLTQLKQRVAALEAQLADKDRELSGMQIATAQVVADFDVVREENTALREELTATARTTDQLSGERADLSAQLRMVEQHFAEATSALAEQHAIGQATAAELLQERAILAEALTELTSLQTESNGLRTTLEQTRAALATAEAERARLGTLEAQLSETQQKLGATEERSQSLDGKCHELTAEVASLRSSLQTNDRGRELMAVRVQLADVEKDRLWHKSAAAQLETDLARAEGESRRLETLTRELRERMEKALQKADAASAEQLAQDHAVLRGIIARQNSELEVRHRDIVRLKRARFGLKLVYALFALGLVGLGVLALQLLPGLHLF